MKRTYISTAALCAAFLAFTALSKCRPQNAALITSTPPLTAGNITADTCEVLAGWQNASAILRLSTPGHLGEVVLVQGEQITITRAHAYAEAPGVWYAEWGLLPESHIRIFANGHAEGEVNGEKIYFTPLGSGECLPE